MSVPTNFKEYYQYYLTLHSNPICRRLHVVGQLATIAYVVFFITKGEWVPLVLAPFIVYPFAWAGHFFYEDNRPAAWSNPFWAKLSDFKMFWDIITRRIKL
tara:strand:+ start:156 stop:458 length:303 start_codon:yes stop_codon:yes gene_type:complete